MAGAPAAADLRGGRGERRQPHVTWLDWSRGVPQTNAGDLKMVTEWSRLGFVVRNPICAGAMNRPRAPATR